MTKLFLLLVLAVSLNSVAVDLTGSWNVRNMNEDKKMKYKTFALGVLGSADAIQFKDDGTFFCNDTLYGKYSFKGDELVITRDSGLVKKLKEKMASSVNLRAAAMMSPDRFERDSFLVTFSRTGNRALVLSHLGFIPIAIAFTIDKQGTNGAGEDLNEGASLVGRKFKMGTGLKNSYIVQHFLPDGKHECESFILGKEKKDVGSYTIKGNKLTMKLEGESLEGEFFFNQKGLLLVIDDDGLLMPTQLLEVW